MKAHSLNYKELMPVEIWLFSKPYAECWLTSTADRKPSLVQIIKVDRNG